VKVTDIDNLPNLIVAIAAVESYVVESVGYSQFEFCCKKFLKNCLQNKI
jgi:hypothetical protein